MFYHGNGFLSFSDGAKFADVARNIKNGLGYGSAFSFFTDSAFQLTSTSLFSARWISPLMPLAILGSFFVFGVGDLAVYLTSGMFFIGLIILVFLIGRKLYSNFVGLLAAIATAFNINLLDYATSGASETQFIFLILLAIYLFLQKSKRTNVGGYLVLASLYFTRPHAPIYMIGIWLFYLLINYKSKDKLLKMLGISVIAMVLIELFLQLFSGRFFLESVIQRGLIASSYSPAGNVELRGGSFLQNNGFTQLIKSFSYNIYNFYRLLPQIASPYMWGLFVIGIFKLERNRLAKSLKVVTVIMVVVTFFAAAVTVPLFRYLHPVVPLVYLLATAALVWIVQQFSQTLTFKNYQISKKKIVYVISGLLIFFFVIGQTLGIIFLDSRFKKARTNTGKPPVYATLSGILKDNTDLDDVIVTNLDTWGSWYGERKTVWFPLKPNQLEQSDLVFNGIFLTNYLIDDENYYMGKEWRDIFFNPESHNQEYISNNYQYIGEFEVPASETYEKVDGKAVLFVKKDK